MNGFVRKPQRSIIERERFQFLTQEIDSASIRWLILDSRSLDPVEKFPHNDEQRNRFEGCSSSIRASSFG